MRKQIYLSYFFFFLFCLLGTSCVTNRSTRYLQDIEKDYAPASYDEYRLQPQDEIALQLYTTNTDAVSLFSGGQQSVANQIGYRVYDDGTIDVPYLDKIKVAGLTVRETCFLLTDSLKPYISEDLYVKVVLNRKVYYMIGETGKGEYSMYKDRMNIFEALAQGGDLSISANRKNIKILRKTEGKEQLVQFDIRSKDIVDSEYYYIRPNDIIFVSQTNGSFFKITSFTTFLGVITSSISFILLVLQYTTN